MSADPIETSSLSNEAPSSTLPLSSTDSSPPSTPPPSRSASIVEERPSLVETQEVQETFTEYQVTTNDSDAEFDEKVLESDTFQWRELTTFTQPIGWDSPPVVQEESEVDSEEIPPLISDSEEETTGDSEDHPEDAEEETTGDSEDDPEDAEEETNDDSENESNTEEHVEQQEEQEEEEQDPVPTPPAHDIPPLLTFLGILLFLLHLLHHAQLLEEKAQREKNPCFLFRY